ncbi:hypothetical protein D9M72_463730 [compost metagenome]
MATAYCSSSPSICLAVSRLRMRAEPCPETLGSWPSSIRPLLNAPFFWKCASICRTRSIAVGASADKSLACEPTTGGTSAASGSVTLAKSYCVSWPCSSLAGSDTWTLYASPFARPLVVTAVSVPELK